MKEIIAVDFDGALLDSRPFDQAHKKWFELFSKLLNDKKILEWKDKENYFEGVQEVMKKYLGEVDSKAKNYFARQTYAMTTLAEVKEEDLNKKLVKELEELKKEHELALITSAPQSAVKPILQKLRIEELFDHILASPMHKKPDKKELFKKFIAEKKKPIRYIGKKDKFYEEFQNL